MNVYEYRYKGNDTLGFIDLPVVIAGEAPELKTVLSEGNNVLVKPIKVSDDVFYPSTWKTCKLFGASDVAASLFKLSTLGHLHDTQLDLDCIRK